VARLDGAQNAHETMLRNRENPNLQVSKWRTRADAPELDSSDRR
jgi:hypothetical protein